MAHIVSKETAPVQPSAQPHSSQMRKRHNTKAIQTTMHCKHSICFRQHDEVSQQYQDMEHNIRLYRGKPAREIYNRTDFKQLKANGITQNPIFYWDTVVDQP